MKLIDDFLDWAHAGLMASDEAQAYLRGRGASEDQWRRHRLGYVAGDYDVDSSADPGHDPERCSDYDKKHVWCDSCRLRSWSSTWERTEEGAPKVQLPGRRIAGSVVLPLTSYSGQAVGFQVRSVREKSYDTFALRRRPEGYFFGIGPNVGEVWASGSAWLVEGPFDQLVVERLVSPTALALTTAGVSTLQLRFLRRFVRRIYLCLDMDKAGRDGVRSFISRHGDGFEVLDVSYRHPIHKVKDANDLWKKLGDSKFAAHIRRCI